MVFMKTKDFFYVQGMGIDNQLRLNAYMLEPALPLIELSNDGRNKSLGYGKTYRGLGNIPP